MAGVLPRVDGGIGHGGLLAALLAAGRRLCRVPDLRARPPGAGGARAIVALHVVFLLAPPLLSGDVFSYIAYGRLGAVHGISPYLHGPAAAPHDPGLRYVAALWAHTPSAYGPLFTILSYGLGSLGIAAALWGFKVAGGARGLAVVALVWRIAERAGGDPRTAAADRSGSTRSCWSTAVGGGHNDLLMLALTMLGVLLVCVRPAGGAAVGRRGGGRQGQRRRRPALPLLGAARAAARRGARRPPRRRRRRGRRGVRRLGPRLRVGARARPPGHQQQPGHATSWRSSAMCRGGGRSGRSLTVVAFAGLLGLVWRGMDWVAGAGLGAAARGVRGQRDVRLVHDLAAALRGAVLRPAPARGDAVHPGHVRRPPGALCPRVGPAACDRATPAFWSSPVVILVATVVSVARSTAFRQRLPGDRRALQAWTARTHPPRRAGAAAGRPGTTSSARRPAATASACSSAATAASSAGSGSRRGRRSSSCRDRPASASRTATPPVARHADGRGGGDLRRSGAVQASAATVRGLVSRPSPWQLLGPKPLAAKVPEITALFWVIKVLTTGIGESSSDFLGEKSIPLAALIGSLGLVVGAVAAAARHALPRAGLLVRGADGGGVRDDGRRRRQRGAGLPYAVTHGAVAVAVAVIFFALASRRGHAGHPQHHHPATRGLLLVAVLATFALGTAAGDLTAFTLHLGFFASVLLFAVVIAVPAVGWWRFGLNPVVAFWAAYVVTRPLGASFADWFGKPHDRTGLGARRRDGQRARAAVFVLLVAYTAWTKRDIQPAAAEDAHRHPHGLPRLGELGLDARPSPPKG